MDADSLTPLRDALRQPDRRSWRRHLRRGQAAPGLRDTAPPDLTAEGSPAPGAGGARNLPWWAAGAAVLAIAGGIVLLGGWLPVAPPTARTDAALAPATSRFDPTTEAEPVPAPVPGATASTAASTPERLWPPAPLEVVGRQVRTPAGRWEIGEEGDAIVLGDWDCDRRSTPAVLRPSTGRLAVFDRWAAEDDPEPARPVSMIEGAAEIRPTSRCGEIAVRTNEGNEQVVDTRPRTP